MVNEKDSISNDGEERVGRDGYGGAIGALGLVSYGPCVAKGRVLAGKVPSRWVGISGGVVGVWWGVDGWWCEGLAACSCGVEEAGLCWSALVAVVLVVSWRRIESRHCDVVGEEEESNPPAGGVLMRCRCESVSV